MTTVGVRELRQRASELLRLVADGQSIEITDRGTPVAVLGPVGDPVTPLERLRRSGALRAAVGSPADAPPPLAVQGEAPSEVLARLRADER